MEQLNVKEVKVERDMKKFASYVISPVQKSLGPSLRDKYGAAKQAIETLPLDEIERLVLLGEINIQFIHEGMQHTLPVVLGKDVELKLNFTEDTSRYVGEVNGAVMVVLDKQADAECHREGVAREIVSRVQMARKEAKLTIEDEVDLVVVADNQSAPICCDALEQCQAYIHDALRQELLRSPPLNRTLIVEIPKEVLSEPIKVMIFKSK